MPNGNELTQGVPSSVKVRQGDTLSAIAQKYGFSTNDLIAANPHITNPGRIFPGNVVTLPPAELRGRGLYAPAQYTPPPAPAPPPPSPRGGYTIAESPFYPPSGMYRTGEYIGYQTPQLRPGETAIDVSLASPEEAPKPPPTPPVSPPPRAEPASAAPPVPYDSRMGTPGDLSAQYAQPYPPGLARFGYPSYWGQEVLPRVELALSAMAPEVGPMGRVIGEASALVTEAAQRLGLRSTSARGLASELTARPNVGLPPEPSPHEGYYFTRQEPPFGGERLPRPGLPRQPAVGEAPPGSYVPPEYVWGGPHPQPSPTGAIGESAMPGLRQAIAEQPQTGGLGLGVRSMSPWERLGASRGYPYRYGQAASAPDPFMTLPSFEVDHGKAASDLGYSTVAEAVGVLRGADRGEVLARLRGMSLSDRRNAASALISQMAPEHIAELPAGARDILFGRRTTRPRQMAEDISTMHTWATGEGSPSLSNLLFAGPGAYVRGGF